MSKDKDEKEIKKKYESYRKQLSSEQFDIDSELIFNENEEAVVDCKVGKIENMFSPYDIAKNRTITESFHNYLIQETEIIPIKYDLELRLHIDKETTPEAEEQMKKAIKRHYSFMITSSNVKLNKSKISAFILYGLGLMLLFLNFFLTSRVNLGLPVLEASLILSWFLIWEASGLMFLRRKSIKNGRYNMLRIYNSRVSFIRDED